MDSNAIVAKIKTVVDFFLKQYERLMSMLLHINPSKVNKDRYVRKVVGRFFEKEAREEAFQRAMATSLAEVLTEEQQKRQYRRITRRHAWAVFAMSFVTTLPESIWGIVIACAIDFIFFQMMLYHAMQMIMQLYGRDLDLNRNEEKGVETIIAIESSGVMLGKYPLLQKLKSVVGWVMRQVVKRIGPKITSKLSRTAFVVLRRQSIKWISVVAAKNNIEIIIDALIPITCAMISGLVSVAILIPMCNKLRKSILKTNSEIDNPTLN